MTQFNDTINKLLGTVVSAPSNDAILISLGTALLLSAILWIAYRLANTAATYQPNFAATLVSLAIISTVLMDLIQSNLALSLGMLGSLSIVRFRTNIKDPRDIGFIFWSMSIGLASACGSYFIGVAGSVILAIFMIVTRKKDGAPDDMLLVVRGSSADIGIIHSIVEQDSLRNSVRAKNILSDSFELVYAVRIANQNCDNMIEKLFELGGIDSVNLLAGENAA